MSTTYRSLGRFAVAALVAAGLAGASAAALGGETKTVTFEQAAIGSLPAGFSAALTGRGRPVKWGVVADPGATGGKALADTSVDTTDYRFPLAIYDVTATDVEVSIRFRPVSGRVDQAAGIAVRIVDADNYYVVRANALENNVNFYRVVRGNRLELAGTGVRVAPNTWHTLTLRAEGERFTVLFNGTQQLVTTDRTFANAGKVGLWTKADSVTHFDKLAITPLP